MKKIFTLFVSCALVLSVNAQKKVGYYGLDKSSTGTAAMDATAQYDPILKMLQADPNLTVTVNLVTATGTAAPIGWNNFDVVILQESIGSANLMVKDLNITAVTKPYLINKSYAFKAGSLFTTGTGAGLEGTGTALKVMPNQSTHDLFKAVTITNDTINCFKFTTTDLGAAGVKALNHNTAVVLGGGTLLAQPNSHVGTSVLAVNDIPSGTAIGSATTSARVITIGMNYGAICGDNMQNISIDALTMWRNAVYILAGLTVPATPAVRPSLSGIQSAATSKLSYLHEGNNISVNFGVSQKAEVAVYNLAGQLIAKKLVNADNAPFDLTNAAKGVYIMKIAGSKVSGTNKFVVE